MEKKLTKDEYEIILYKHDFQKDVMDKVFILIEDYIRRNNKILVGGMAIDFALRSIGKSLYPDNKFPDYDFISSEFHKDAYNICELLTKEIDGVDAIRGLHISTMRVRVNFQEGADITYVPDNILKNIPTIKYKGFNVVHPHYQMIDQHRSLSLPYEKPPLETVIGRWDKDIERYDLLNENFPLKEVKIPEFSLVDYKISYNLLDGECISGYSSLLFWINFAKKEGFVFNSDKNKTNTGVNSWLNSWLNSWSENTKGILLKLPKPAYFSILTDDINSINKKFPGEKKYYNPLLDKIPYKILVRSKNGDYEILDNRGDLRGAYKPYKTKRIWVSNLQEVMCNLLTLAVFYKSTLANNTYIIAQKLLFWASEKYTKTKDKKYLLFLPTTEVYGQYNIYGSEIINKENFKVNIEKKERSIFIPKNVYPDKNTIINKSLYDYDPKSHNIYKFDGNEKKV